MAYLDAMDLVDDAKPVEKAAAKSAKKKKKVSWDLLTLYRNPCEAFRGGDWIRDAKSLWDDVSLFV